MLSCLPLSPRLGFTGMRLNNSMRRGLRNDFLVIFSLVCETSSKVAEQAVSSKLFGQPCDK